jgi:integrase
MWGKLMADKKRVKFRKRELNRLEPITLNKLKVGRHMDGNGLMLVVTPSGSRSWILRTLVRGRRRDIGLGGLSTLSLADARTQAAALRANARKGEDILAKKRIEQRKSNAPTFEEAARIVHKEVVPSLKNEHNKNIWIRSLEIHIFAVFGQKRINEVDSADILRAILPIWTVKTDMARKTLARVSRVMDWARGRKYMDVMVGDIAIPLPNPCTGIHSALPKQPKGEHQASIPFEQLPEFITKLRADTSAGTTVKLAMELTVLTVLRTSEVLEAEWVEIDLDKRLWRIPAVRMKMTEPHELPLSDRVVAIFEQLKPLSPDGKRVFDMSNVTMLRALQRMDGYEDFTMHGMRASFKTWAHRKTKYDRLVIEACLAHQVEDDVERSYLRTRFVDERKKLMQLWCDFVTGKPSAKVVRMG